MVVLSELQLNLKGVGNIHSTFSMDKAMYGLFG